MLCRSTLIVGHAFGLRAQTLEPLWNPSHHRERLKNRAARISCWNFNGLIGGRTRTRTLDPALVPHKRSTDTFERGYFVSMFLASGCRNATTTAPLSPRERRNESCQTGENVTSVRWINWRSLHTKITEARSAIFVTNQHASLRRYRQL
jgi:hypothetical protein